MPKRSFSEHSKTTLLESLGKFRAECIQANSRMIPFSPEYNAVSDIITAIDQCAKTFTGDGEMFYLKPHSFSGKIA